MMTDFEKAAFYAGYTSGGLRKTAAGSSTNTDAADAPVIGGQQVDEVKQAGAPPPKPQQQQQQQQAAGSPSVPTTEGPSWLERNGETVSKIGVPLLGAWLTNQLFGSKVMSGAAGLGIYSMLPSNFNLFGKGSSAPGGISNVEKAEQIQKSQQQNTAAVGGNPKATTADRKTAARASMNSDIDVLNTKADTVLAVLNDKQVTLQDKDVAASNGREIKDFVESALANGGVPKAFFDPGKSKIWAAYSAMYPGPASSILNALNKKQGYMPNDPNGSITGQGDEMRYSSRPFRTSTKWPGLYRDSAIQGFHGLGLTNGDQSSELGDPALPYWIRHTLGGAASAADTVEPYITMTHPVGWVKAALRENPLDMSKQTVIPNTQLYNYLYPDAIKYK
jgi:hypothetical protein